MNDISSSPSASPSPAVARVFWGMSENTYSMLMYLSMLVFFIPFFSLVMPIIMWAINREGSATIDAHGKNILNWIISSVIYGAISFILVFLVVGTFLLIALGICGIIFAIIGGIKANQGVVWRIPLAIRFIK